MFTGIIRELGTVEEVRAEEAAAILVIACSFADTFRAGDSVAVQGACLTVLSVQPGSFSVRLMHETLTRTNLGALAQGGIINLERPLTAGERLDGHFVLGHIDDTVEIVAIKLVGEDRLFTFTLPAHLAQYVISKGSVALDGVSLTVVEVLDTTFTVSMMPYTLRETTFGATSVGQSVNFEADVLGKYVERLLLVRQRLTAVSRESSEQWLRGTVVPGAGRGRKLGFPTANIRLESGQALPEAGVYAGLVQLIGEEGIRRAAIHVGPRPTYHEKPWTFEAHILNYQDGDLYQKPIRVRLVRKIREVEHFSSEQELTAAITRDCQQVVQILSQ